MNYALNTLSLSKEKSGTLKALRTLLGLIRDEWGTLVWAFVFIAITSALNLAAPLFVARVIDTYIPQGNYHQIVVISLGLLVIYIVSAITQYIQIILMGGVGQRLLYTLRNKLFEKLEELPIAFFNQNKSGDLISRINNDTDKLNQFFSQSLMQFVGSIMIMIGAAIFMLSIDVRLGLVALAPAFVLLIFTQAISPWVKRKNANSMSATGGLSAEVQESIENFKVIIAFNRRDYFRKKFASANDSNYAASIGAGIANNTFTPVYGFATGLAQLLVLMVGISFIVAGNFTIGFLISFIAYATNFYNPLRQLAAIWSSFQIALAGWDRISRILSLSSDLVSVEHRESVATTSLLSFQDVSFRYPDKERFVLKNISFELEKGKTYALVGPTGGGKSTTASLMARLYDPTEGKVLWEGHDIRSVVSEKRTGDIGFILQDPLLFSGTVKDNILYGNTEYQTHSDEQLVQILGDAGLSALLERFDEGLSTAVTSAGGTLSIGQKQLIAFMRAVLRKPKLLILDEATANIDTVTEQLLDDILAHLPQGTTTVIIAHRLNTIANADEIFFVNGGGIIPAGSMEHAVEMLMSGKRGS